MSRTVISVLITLIACVCGQTAIADTFTVNFHDLAGEPLRGTLGRHNSLVVYQEVRGSRVDNNVNNVVVSAPKLQIPVVVQPDPVDLDDDGQIVFSLNLGSDVGDRAIVIVAQRFDEIIPSTALPFVLVSQDNSQAHVFDVVVPRVSSSAPAPTYRSTPPQPCRPQHRCFLFRRRCR